MSPLLLVLTGAGISAESGIPTFRGADGYWRVGSTNYHPQELATRAAFAQMPDEVWAWYLFRRRICREAEPNAAHHALVSLERACPDAFLLVTQNVDGLHARAGQSRERMYEIHGRIDRARCFGECGAPLCDVPSDVGIYTRDTPRLRVEDREKLRCVRCGGWLRPHVLWFDESYDEEHFHFESALAAAERASHVLLVGTTLQTTLPHHVVRLAIARGVPVDRVDPEADPLEAVASTIRGAFHRARATEAVPAFVAALSTRAR